MASLLAAAQLGAPSDTYLFSIARATTGFAVIGSDDNLRLFDNQRLDLQHAISKCNVGVECLVTSNDRQTLFTAGRDALIRAWDARTAAKTLEAKEPKSAGISALSFHGNYIAAGTESTKEGLGDVSVHVYDVRKANSVLRTYGESHTDTITDLAWHPSHSNLLLSGSTDGLVSIFDVEQTEEDDAIQQVLNPRSAVHCSGFIADDQAYVLTTDEQFFIYGLDKTGTAEEEPLPVALFGDLRPKLDCMYVIKLVQTASSPVLACGHNEKKKLAITVLSRSDYAFERTVDLPGAHGDEVVRDVMFVDDTHILSCGEDGHVRYWDLGHASQSDTAMDIDEPKSKKKRAKKDKKHAERYTPY